MKIKTLLPEIVRKPVTPSIGLLLESRVPARLAWVAADGTPRVAPIWFLWTGAELVMSTFAGSRKLLDIIDGTVVALTIDTETFPYRSLNLRGPVSVRAVTGLADEYQAAAHRYLGRAMAGRWIDFLNGADQVVLTLRPNRATASDMAADSPFMEA